MKFVPEKTPQEPRILILDDEQHRHDRLGMIFQDAFVAHSWTVDECISKLATERWDLVCLDNDLRTENWEREGVEVAKFIVKMATAFRPKQVLVHSWNVDAADLMTQILTDAGVQTTRAEFGTFSAVVTKTHEIRLLRLGKIPESNLRA